MGTSSSRSPSADAGSQSHSLECDDDRPYVSRRTDGTSDFLPASILTSPSTSLEKTHSTTSESAGELTGASNAESLASAIASQPSPSTTPPSITSRTATIDNDHPYDQMSLTGDEAPNPRGWGIIQTLGNWGLLRRRVGADVYDDEKAHNFRNHNNNVCDNGPQNAVNFRFPDGLTPLTSAIRSSNTAAVDAFLQHPGIDVNLPERQQYSLYSHIQVPPIIVAARTKNIDIVEKLLDKGANINAVDSNKETALFTACESGDVDLVTLLLNRGSRMTSSTDVYNPLHAACRGGHFDCVKLLVEAGCDINPSKDNRDLLHPLHLAISNKHEDISLYLLQKGSWFYIRNSVGMSTPFTTACSYRCPEVVQYLIGTGNDVNVITISGCPAIVQALGAGDLQSVAREVRISQSSEQLLEKYRNILSESVKVLGLLCEAGCDIEISSGMIGLSPLCLALKCGNLPSAITLLKHGARWTSECDGIFTKYDLKRVQKVYPEVFKCLFSFLDGRRTNMYTKYTSTKTVTCLKAACRSSIRSAVSRYKANNVALVSSIRMLPLPPLLLNYVCYEDVNELSLINHIPLPFLEVSA